MKKLILIAALAAPVGHVSASGIPTIDVAMMAQELAHYTVIAQNWVEQLQTVAATASTVSATYEALRGVTNLHDVIRSPLLTQYLPADYLSIYNSAIELGAGALFGESLNLYNSGLIRDVCQAIQQVDVKLNCEARQTSAYKLQATSNAVYQNVVNRADQIDKLTKKLATMEDPKQVLDLQTMIATEVAAIQNESVRVEALRMAHEASEAVARQQQAQLASRMWDIETGIPLEPIEFGER